MTNREFFAAVANANISDELTVKAQELIASLDARNAKRKTAPSKEKVASAERRNAVLAFLKANEGSFTREQIATELEIDAPKVTGACNILIKDGLVTKSNVKIDKATKVAYSIA